MNKSNLLQALLESKAKLSLSKPAHRKAIEEITDSFLEQHPLKSIPEEVTNESKLSELLQTMYEKRRAEEALLDEAAHPERLPKTRVFTEEELNNKYKPWHQQYQNRHPFNAKEYKRKIFNRELDELDDTPAPVKYDRESDIDALIPYAKIVGNPGESITSLFAAIALSKDKNYRKAMKVYNNLSRTMPKEQLKRYIKGLSTLSVNKPIFQKSKY